MKKSFTLIVLLLFLVLCANVFSQTKYPFEVTKSGHGKKAIVFIPGFASSGDVWNDTKAQFERTHTCYTLTMPGFAGVSPQADPTFIKWENQIANFIQDEKMGKPIIVGHSMGGGLALAIAADYPDLAEKIVVVDALPYLAAMMNPEAKPAANNDCGPMIRQMTSITDEQFLQMQNGSIARLVTDKQFQETVVGWSVKSDRKTFAEMYCDFLNTDLREKIKTIKCPTLILLESSFAQMKPIIEEQYKNLQNANFQYAGKGLHFIMYDDKEWYLKQLTQFVN